MFFKGGWLMAVFLSIDESKIAISVVVIWMSNIERASEFGNPCDVSDNNIASRYERRPILGYCFHTLVPDERPALYVALHTSTSGRMPEKTLMLGSFNALSTAVRKKGATVELVTMSTL